MTNRPKNPKIVAIAERGKAFWAQRSPIFEKQIQNATQVTAATEAIEREMLKAKATGDFRAVSTLEEKLEEYARLRASEQSTVARKVRPRAQSPFTTFFLNRMNRDPTASNREIADALLTEAASGNEGQGFQFSDEERDTIVHVETERELKVASVDSAVARARDRNSRR